MNEVEFNSIFSSYKDNFLESVKSFSSEFSIGIKFNRSAFQMFEDNKYWEQTYYINLMEKRIRKYLATGVLTDLLRYHNYEIIEPERKTYRVSSDVYDEEDTQFQFAIKSDPIVFVKYSDIPYDDTELTKIEKSICHSNRIKHSRRIVLLWDNKRHDPDGIHISLSDFFEEFLTIELYHLYVNNVAEAVEEAENQLGYQTIVRFTSTNAHRLIYTQHLSTIKENYVEKIYSDISTDYFATKVFRSAKRELSEQGKKNVFEKYLLCDRYLALVGSENYAKSFLTAESLFNTYTGDEYFDFTAITACYSKAVEQLLFTATMIYISAKKPTDSVIIRDEKRPKSVLVNTKTECKWKEYFGSLGSLNYFLFDNKDLTILSNTDRLAMAAIINRYTHECRNVPFHSSTLTWPEVKIIRDNSLIVLQTILGALKIENNDGLGIIDDEFDRLFCALFKPAKFTRSILFIFGEEEIWATPEPINTPLTILYDSNQRIRSLKLKYIVDEANNSALKKGDSIVISEMHIPDKAFFRGRSGLIEIKW